MFIRDKNYEKKERRKCREEKKLEWAKKGGHIAPIFVPATPGSQLVKEMRKVAYDERKDGIHFNIVETGGKTLKRELQKSNPTAAPGCDKTNCPCCNETRGRGGQCHRANVNYEVMCGLCPKNSSVKYIGETSRNLYTRMNEHLAESEKEGLFMRKHMEENHMGEESRFIPRVTHTNKEPLTRQIREGVLIRHNHNAMNTKSEWHLPALYRIHKEMIRY